MENGHLKWIYPLKLVIFDSYVKLPEGKKFDLWHAGKAMKNFYGNPTSPAFAPCDEETCGLESFLSETTAQAGRFRASELQGGTSAILRWHQTWLAGKYTTYG